MIATADLIALLHSSGWLDEESARVVRREAASADLAPVLLVRRLGRVSDARILDTLREHVGLEVVDPSADQVVDLEALRWLPRDVAEAHLVLPLGVTRVGEDRVMRLAMADPLHAPSVRAVEAASEMVVDPVLAEAGALERAIASAYGRITTRLIPRPVPDAARSRPRWRGASRAEPETTPAHRLEDEATPLQQVEAIRRALERKGLLTREEFVTALRQVLRGEEER